MIETKRLLIDIAKQMEWLYRYVGSTKAALQERPEVLDAIGVYVALYVTLKMIHDVVGVAFRQSVIVDEFVSHDPSAGKNVFVDDLVHGLFLALVAENLSTHFP